MAKNTLFVHDNVSWLENGEKRFGKIVEIKGDIATVESFYCDLLCTFEISVDQLSRVPVVHLSKRDLKALCRYEKTYSGLMKRRGSWENGEYTQETYKITPEDLKAAIQNFEKSGKPMIEFYWQWYGDVIDNLMRAEIAKYNEDYRESLLTGDGMPSETRVFCTAMRMIKYEALKDETILQQVIEDRLEEANDEIKTVYRKYLDELCEKDDIDALRCKGYACYGNGNAVYGQDWIASRDCFLKMMELNPSGETANTLGYIYYYGRCNGGVPEYDKAFRYFMQGAMGGITESWYKLADMYISGYGTNKHPEVAYDIIMNLYKQQKTAFEADDPYNDFADVALRAGNLYKDGIGCEPDPDRAYEYYLESKDAIQKRMEEENYYGDDKVLANIEAAIKEIQPRVTSKP